MSGAVLWQQTYPVGYAIQAKVIDDGRCVGIACQQARNLAQVPTKGPVVEIQCLLNRDQAKELARILLRWAQTPMPSGMPVKRAQEVRGEQTGVGR